MAIAMSDAPAGAGKDSVKTLKLIAVLSALLLAGCSSVDPRTDGQEHLLRARLASLLAGYNTRHGTHIELPDLSVEDQPDHPAMVAVSYYARWSITVNQAWIHKDPCLVYHEAVAHELAHLIVQYQQYGEPHTMVVMTRQGMEVVAVNEQSWIHVADEDHGSAWRAVAFELEADPCKEGYCKDARPFSRYPRQCAATDVAWTLDPDSERMAGTADVALDRDKGKVSSAGM